MKSHPYRFEVAASRSFLAVRQESFIAGPFPDIRWQQMRDVGESIAYALAAFYEIDQIAIDFMSGIETSDDVVVPSVRCMLPLPNQVSSEDVDRVVQQLLVALTTPQHDFQPPLFAPGISDVVQETVKAHAQDFLARKGGERIAIPMTIRSANGDIGQLHGAFGPRPPDVLDPNEFKIHRATTVMLHTERREGLAITIGERKRIGFRFSDQHKEALGWSLIHNAPIEMTFEENLDAKGRRMFLVHKTSRSDGRSETDFSLA